MKTTNFEDRLDEIRVSLYEESKHLDGAAFVEWINAQARGVAAEYGFTIVKSAAESRRRKTRNFAPVGSV
ncbi:hypothetical protein AGMMS49959_15840 [Planctomycetales bacterium]|nr:hypothetical protein AGMMS49959_15730 [Planctomycetales bacterium]GHV23274.1 hypothetical protein AGMMS49959_15840 [Planctomycetales bacterium]